MKLNVLLAKTDHSESQFKKLFSDTVAFFKGKQGEFRGIKKTYAPRPETIDLPTERAFIAVVTTVGEKLDYIEETAEEHIDNLFSVEATNASGQATADLIVDGTNWGTLSSLELLRLKSLLEKGGMEDLYANIPVRSDSDIWNVSDDPAYVDRDVYEGPQQSGTKKSITKESYILPDPNVQYLKDTSKYVPVQGVKDTIMELGDYTIQHFSGEYSHRDRAGILGRRSKLLSGVIEALKKANEAESVPSAVTADRLFSYLHG